MKVSCLQAITSQTLATPFAKEIMDDKQAHAVEKFTLNR
jgi:hypothetical protein